jgi:ABC-type Fe3+/spermidine/putrescine transport system ATPase subunit
VSSGFVQLQGLVKRFGDHVAVSDLSLALERGEVLALLGPSGSGKTTALRLLAGFETPDAGQVRVDGQDVTALPPARRRFGMVFQHYALFPHLDVGENVAFGLPSRLSQGERAARVEAALAQVDLGGLQRRRVGELSGGQQQRVALARALAPEPRVLLLDEPLSNLDPALRERTRRELREVVRRVGITTVLVTHEQDEAFELGDRIALLRRGRLEQVGAPAALYAHPETPFVASFLGRASRVAVLVKVGPAGTLQLHVAGGIWKPVEPHVHPGVGVGRALLYVRPEALRLGTEAGAVEGEVAALRFVGSGVLVCVRLEDGTEVDVAAPVGATEVGARVGIMSSRRARGGFHLFPLGA